jgi:hypothetical protein
MGGRTKNKQINTRCICMRRLVVTKITHKTLTRSNKGKGQDD